MSDPHNAPGILGALAQGAQLVGQPFTLLSIGVPVNLTLTCNCQLDVERPVLVVALSVPARCEACRTTYNAFFDPQTGTLQMQGVKESADATGTNVDRI